MSAGVGQPSPEAMAAYEENVFINCPFDAEYKGSFQAIVFTVHDCGFTARCALETDDSGQVRFAKLVSIVAECRFGVHDLSRTELSVETSLPRFNMPLELGLFLGAKSFGAIEQLRKIALILDVEPWRYQKFCSDIAGQDIKAHGGKIERMISAVRDWLRSAAVHQELVTPGGKIIHEWYLRFQRDLPGMCAKAGLERDQLIFREYITLVQGWLVANKWLPANLKSPATIHL